MNQQVRKYLIDIARVNKPVYYEDVVRDCNLKINLSTISDRNELSKILGDIATFEHNHKRPLLSALAIYKATKDHADGFYTISESLGYGDKKNLKEKLFGFEQLKLCREFWSDENNYRDNYELDKEKPKIHNYNFFETSEIEFLAHWAGRVYEKSNPEHVAAKNYIMNSLGSKIVYWSNELVKRLPDYETFNWRIWSQKGWDDSSGVNKPVAKFKHYTWARIYKKGDENKDIFFTVEADSIERALVYKLDYYFESTSFLSEKQKTNLRARIPENLRKNVISFDALEDYNWDRLINLTTSFIAENSELYDTLIHEAWGNNLVKGGVTHTLTKRLPQLARFEELPRLNPSFKGVEIDFEDVSNQSKELGDAGEQLVLNYEKNKLRTLGKVSLADKVEKVKDGRGFDILSFDENENEIFLEVKNTTGNQNTPFNLSINEYLFAKENRNNYFLYRLYNYNDELNNADFFIIEDPIDKLLFQPTNFRIYHKK